MMLIDKLPVIRGTSMYSDINWIIKVTVVALRIRLNSVVSYLDEPRCTFLIVSIVSCEALVVD